MLEVEVVDDRGGLYTWTDSHGAVLDTLWVAADSQDVEGIRSGTLGRRPSPPSPMPPPTKK